jgi:hypothetical protein
MIRKLSVSKMSPKKILREMLINNFFFFFKKKKYYGDICEILSRR